MAYLTLAGIDENNCFRFIGMSSGSKESTSLLGANSEPISLISSNDNLDSCSFYSGPSDATITAFGETSESCGSIAYAGGESCGSIAYSGDSGTCCSTTSFASSSSTGSACSYSC